MENVYNKGKISYAEYSNLVSINSQHKNRNTVLVDLMFFEADDYGLYKIPLKSLDGKSQSITKPKRYW